MTCVWTGYGEGWDEWGGEAGGRCPPAVPVSGALAVTGHGAGLSDEEPDILGEDLFAAVHGERRLALPVEP